jgi:hypothetical protein
MAILIKSLVNKRKIQLFIFTVPTLAVFSASRKHYRFSIQIRDAHPPVQERCPLRVLTGARPAQIAQNALFRQFPACQPVASLIF